MRNKIWGGFLLAVTLAVLVPKLASATTIDTQSTTIGDNNNSPKNIILRREISGVKNYVDVAFRYELLADENNPAAVGNMPDERQSISVNTMPNSHNVATGTAAINMAPLEFSELGDYKFTVREIYSSDPENYPVDEEHLYYFYVSVRNEVVNNVPTGNLVATLIPQARNYDTGEKTSIVFSGQAVRTYMELSKNVTGNLANTEEYFKFLVKINGRAGDSYTIDGQDANVTYGGENITTTSNFVVSDDGIEVYLRHGQTIRIGQDADGMLEMPIGATYTIQEIDAEDYSTTVDGSEGKITGTKTTAVLLEGDILPDSNQTEFVNNKNSAVLTGVTLAMIPAVVLIVTMFTGAVVVRKIKKSSNKR